MSMNKTHLSDEKYGKPIAESFSAFLERRIAECGEHNIIHYREKWYNWNDIDRISNVIAYELAKTGVKKGTHVGICGINSINWVSAFFAVHKLGAISVLLNYNLKPKELSMFSVIGDITHLCYGDMPEMLKNPDYMNEIKQYDECVIRHYYNITSAINYENKIAEKIEKTPTEADDPCLMIFTSGSTSMPKAVLTSAYNVINSAYFAINTSGLSTEDINCLVLPAFHIFGLTGGLIAPFLVNSPVYILSSFKTDDILKCLDSNKCTVMHSVPTLMLAIAMNKRFFEYDVSKLRSSYLAGAAILPAQMQFLQSRFPNNHFGICYGMSELPLATITSYNEKNDKLCNTIGQPAYGVNIRIVNNITGEECGINQDGELIIKSDYQMVCYYKLAVAHQPIDSLGAIHTGDVGHYDDDGYIHLAGRLKDLIIRGGENISPAEVEKAILEHEAVNDVKVVAVPSEFWGEEVGACIIFKQGKTLTKEQLTEFLQDKISKFKIPVCVFEYDSFPMLTNGKIDMVSLKKNAADRFKTLHSSEH